MKNKVIRTITTGMFIKSQIEIENPMEAALITVAVETLLKQFQNQQVQDLKTDRILNELSRDNLKNTEIQELSIKYLEHMSEALKVKNEVLTIVE